MLEKYQTKRLLDIAFLGCQRGETALARKVIAGLDLLLDDSVELEICRAMSHYTVDEFEPAREVLTAALDRFPNEPLLGIHLALVDHLTDQDFQARERLDQVLASDADSDVLALARAIREEC
ncbi:MAG: hypothetical protein MI747_15025 [Desulfobacterales bacterium]|nr:hypothetical protein [Desulfobacterales bacterium]